MVRDEYNHSRPVSALIRDWLLYNKAGGGGGILKTVTGNPISVSDALAAPIQSLSVSLSPIQEGSGDPSPDNIRPITGRESVTVERTVVNLWDEEWEVGGIDTDGNKVSQANRIRSKNFINITPETNYYIVIDGTGFTLYPCFYDRNGGFITRGTYLSASGVRKSPVDAYKMMFYIWKSAWTDYENHPDISINYPSTATEYEPYDGQSVTVQLGQTVYGGTVDVTTGKATIAWKKYIGSAFANASARTGGFYSRMLLGGETYAGGQIAPARYACNAAVKSQNQYDKWYYNAAGTVGSTVNYVHMYIPADAIDYHEGDNVNTLLNAAYNASDFEFILPIPEPFDIDITPASLSTVKGDNNVWSDGDEVTMIYKAVSS